MQIITADGKTEKTLINTLRGRYEGISGEIGERVGRMLGEIRNDGAVAVRRFSKELDGAEPYEIPRQALAEAEASCDKDLLAALKKARDNVRQYHEKMLARSWEWKKKDGVTLGQTVRGLSRVGIYVPGGTAAYPSTVIMNAVPARVAGVGEIIMVTPPGENLKPSVLAAASLAGVDRVFAIGGVQAIAAMAYGIGIVPKVDKIVGPGNAYVAAAKKAVFGAVDIDMIAGPSEILVICDETANPAFAAADLLSQAEHDRLSSAILISTDAAVAGRVCDEVATRLEKLPRADIARRAVSDFGAAIVCGSIEEAAEIANDIAPEHLEIMTKRPREVLPLIRNAGAVFLGGYTPESLGDYMAGPCHVLPTSGTAAFFSPLSTDSFLKKTSVIEFDKQSLSELCGDIAQIAGEEGLAAHAEAALLRFDGAAPTEGRVKKA